MKRFTETTKWDDPWFRRLAPLHKNLWQYICDKCDPAGVIEFDPETASFFIGDKIVFKDLEAFGERLESLPGGKWRLKRFIEFQYGRLSADCKPHIQVFAALARHNIDPATVDQKDGIGRGGLAHFKKLRVIARDGLVCAYTGKEITPEEAEIDHVHPESKGGSDDYDNLVVASREMNRRKGTLSLEEFCRVEKLDFTVILNRILERVGKGFPKASESLMDKDKTIPINGQEKDKDVFQGRVQRGEPTPTVEEALGYAKGATVPLSPECVAAWHDDRTRADWCFPKAGQLYPVRDWRADLRSYARTWQRIAETEKAPGAGGARPGAKRPMSAFEIEKRIDAAREAKGAIMGVNSYKHLNAEKQAKVDKLNDSIRKLKELLTQVPE